MEKKPRTLWFQNFVEHKIYSKQSKESSESKRKEKYIFWILNMALLFVRCFTGCRNGIVKINRRTGTTTVVVVPVTIENEERVKKLRY